MEISDNIGLFVCRMTFICYGAGKGQLS